MTFVGLTTDEILSFLNEAGVELPTFEDTTTPDGSILDSKVPAQRRRRQVSTSLQGDFLSAYYS